MRVLVAGGGIGGLTAAIALRHAGHDAVVFERAPELCEVGAGITIQGNAIAALRRIDVDRPILAAGAVIEQASIRNVRGASLSRVSFTKIIAEIGAPSVALHRGTLQRILIAAAGDALRTNAAVTAIHDDADGVTVTLADGRTERGDALIGADGIHSAVRTHLLGELPLRHAGYFAWRGVAPGSFVDRGVVFETWGRGARFGVVSIDRAGGAESDRGAARSLNDGDRTYWFAVLNGAAASPPPLRDAFAAWHAPIPALLAATPDAQIICNDIHELPALPHWGKGRVTLLGDAAHAMTPNLGQGACQAIEDAIVLADCLSRGPTDPTVALREYERLRRPRATWIQDHARSLGAVGQWQNPIACWLRDLAVRATPTAFTLRDVRKVWNAAATAPRS